LKFLRHIAIPLLKATAFDFSMGHQWVPDQKFYLNSFRHKGYWYRGSRREEKSMKLFQDIVQPGMVVAEVGGHIGYISMFFAKLVGPNGMVIVFEPGLNNLNYTRKNLSSLQNVRLEEIGLAAQDGTLIFFEESLTGQNNTFATDFRGVEINQKSAHVAVNVTNRSVKVKTLDNYFSTTTPDFIKIDVEGFEYQVLLGGLQLMKRKTMWMVEVQSNREEIYELLHDHGYVLFNESREILESPDRLKYNTFCLHRTEHQTLLKNLNIIAI
jgi:FkbM family methyltransferase